MVVKKYLEDLAVYLLDASTIIDLWQYLEGYIFSIDDIMIIDDYSFLDHIALMI